MLCAALIWNKNLKLKVKIAEFDVDLARMRIKTDRIRRKTEELKFRNEQMEADRVYAEKELASLKAMIYECNMEIIDRMDGFQFEDFIGRLLERNGYTEIEVTPDSGDKGADVLAVAPDGRLTCFQCKHYTKNVGTGAIQEVLAAMRYYNCRQAAVITNSQYTRQARELAQQTGVFLMDHSFLAQMVENCIAECVEAVKDKQAFLNKIIEARELARKKLYESL